MVGQVSLTPASAVVLEIGLPGICNKECAAALLGNLLCLRRLSLSLFDALPAGGQCPGPSFSELPGADLGSFHVVGFPVTSRSPRIVWP